MAKKQKGGAAPQNIQEAADVVRNIGEVQRSLERINADMNAKIEETKVPFIKEAEECQRKLEGMVMVLYDYAELHRKELTDHEKKGKTVTLPTGSFKWRLTPKSVVITDAEAVVAQLKKLKLKKFIRVKEEPDKKAMLKDEAAAAAIAGVTIVQTEEFVIKPSETRAEVLATKSDKGLKVVSK